MSCWKRLFAGLMAVSLCLAFATLAPAAAKAKPPKGEPAPADSARTMTLDEAFKALPAYEFGQSRLPLTVIADAARDAQGKGPELAKLTDRLTALLGGNATLDAKRFVCRQLSLVGTAKEVPALAALLADKDLADMARYALERIPDAAALDAMRSALAKAAGKAKIGLINSLGDRRDAPSVAVLTAGLRDADPAVASASAAALGKIGGAEALKALTAVQAGAAAELKTVIADAILLCADDLLKAGKKDEAAAVYQNMFKPTEPKQVRVAALRGIVACGGPKAQAVLADVLRGTDKELQAAALRFQREIPAAAATKPATTFSPDLPASTQVMLLDDMAARGDASALPHVMTAAKSQDESVKLAAIRALGKLGNASTLALLAQTAAGAGAAAEAARKSLDTMPAADVNPALMALADKGDPKARAEVVRALGTRHVAAAVAVVLKAAEDAEANVRLTALQTLDLLVDEKSAPAVVGLVAKVKGDSELLAAEKTLGSLCTRTANKDACVDPILAALPGTAMPAKGALIRALGRAGGAKALAAVRNLLKDADAAIQDAAIRSLADWADVSAAPDLLVIAKTAAKPTHQVLALRGYVRMAGAEGLPAADRLKMYQEAMGAAKRPEEKKSVLGGLSGMKTVEALKMVEPCLADETLKEEACLAAVKIAKSLGATGKDVTAAVLQKVLATTKNAGVRSDAEAILKALGVKPAATLTQPREIRVYAAAKKNAAPAAAPAAPVTVNTKVDLSPAEALGWRLAAQAYTFRAVSFAETIDILSKMGMKYVEIYPGQKLKPGSDVKTDHSMSDADLAAMKKIASDAGVKIVNYGVVNLGNDETSARQVFAFAKKVGIETLVTESPESMFGLLDKLTEEYKINIALHNHPKPSRYWDSETVLKGVQGHSQRIGSDSDTGHWMRSGLNPLECLKKLQGHIISLHFKDLDKMGTGEKKAPDGPHDVPWGTGAGNAKAMLAELHRQGFKGVFSIEYEHGSGQELVDNVTQCAQFFAATAAELGKGGAK